MSPLLSTRDEALRTLTLHRPEARNALNAELLAELEGAFSEPPPATERATVLRADGPAFCAGLDLKERSAGRITSAPFEKVLELMESYPRPIVGVVHGDAIAGGNELALHCDFVVASTRASFGMSLAKIGLSPTFFLIKKLLEVAGPVTTREVLLLGEPLPATRMYELGVIARVAPPHLLERSVAEITDRLVANAPLAMEAMKAVIVRGMQFRDGIEHDDVDGLVARAGQSADAKEGIAALFERRPARFEGK